MPYPGLLQPEPLALHQPTVDPHLQRKHSNTVLAQSLWGRWVLVCRGLLELSKCLWWVHVLILNVILPLLPSFWDFSFALGQIAQLCPTLCNPRDYTVHGIL